MYRCTSLYQNGRFPQNGWFIKFQCEFRLNGSWNTRKSVRIPNNGRHIEFPTYRSPIMRSTSALPNTILFIFGFRRIRNSIRWYVLPGFASMCSDSHLTHDVVQWACDIPPTGWLQCFSFSRNIGQVTLKISDFYYLKKSFLDQSIQKIFYLILKKEALAGCRSTFTITSARVDSNRCIWLVKTYV